MLLKGVVVFGKWMDMGDSDRTNHFDVPTTLAEQHFYWLPFIFVLQSSTLHSCMSFTKGRRCFGTIPSLAGTYLSCVLSTSTCPYFNLALENYLLNNPKHFNDKAGVCDDYTLLLYRNAPSVIIGRNQNPFYETRPTFLSSHHINILRRWSGGGAVYHDLGNTNYSLIMPRHAFDRHLAANLVVNALNKEFNTDLFVSENRFDIWSNGADSNDKRKVSGSAYRLQREQAYAHGTMLINSNLSMLEQALTPMIQEPLGERVGGVGSVRSPVSNMSSLKPNILITHSTLSLALFNYFCTVFEHISVVEDVSQSNMMNTSIERDIEVLKSWEWMYGKTPRFTFNDISVENGLVIDAIDKSMIGRRVDSDLFAVKRMRE